MTGARFEKERPISRYGEPVRDRLHLAPPLNEAGALNLDSSRDRSAPAEQTIQFVAVVANDERRPELSPPVDR